MNNEKIVKVTCDCCGTEIECPEEMMKTSKKHLCYSCFQDPTKYNTFTDEERKNVHVDVPMDKISDTIADKLASVMTNETFPGIWSERKEELKACSKKDLAKEMFGAGVYLGILAYMDSMEEMDQREKIIKNNVKP
jgi:hypothetical protein